MKYTTNQVAQIWKTPWGKQKRVKIAASESVDVTRFHISGYVYIIYHGDNKPVKGWVLRSSLSQTEITTLPPPVIITPNDMFRVPETGDWYRLLHDWEWGRRRVGGKPMPETVPTTKQQFAPLDKSWQYFWFELLELSAPEMTEDEIMIAWASLTHDKRAFTDRHAVQNGFADYVLNQNLSAKPIAIKELSCASNIVRAIRRERKCIVVECFDGSYPAPNASDVWNNSPDKIHWATEISTIEYRKRWASGKFPQLNGRGVPFPLLTMTGITRFSLNRVVRIPNGQLYSPYAVSK